MLKKPPQLFASDERGIVRSQNILSIHALMNRMDILKIGELVSKDIFVQTCTGKTYRVEDLFYLSVSPHIDRSNIVNEEIPLDLASILHGVYKGVVYDSNQDVVCDPSNPRFGVLRPYDRETAAIKLIAANAYSQLRDIAVVWCPHGERSYEIDENLLRSDVILDHSLYAEMNRLIDDSIQPISEELRLTVSKNPTSVYSLEHKGLHLHLNRYCDYRVWEACDKAAMHY